MKIKLPTALRSALLAAMAFTAGTAYAAPFDPSVSPGTPPGTTVNGLLVGDSNSITYDLPDTVTTVRGDVVVGAGNRSQDSVQGGAGILNITGSLHVTNSIYAGASGNTSFGDYVDRQGGNGTINVKLDAGETLQVDNAIRLGWLDNQTGTMGIEGGTTTINGQIVLGFYNGKGGPSLGTMGNLLISSATDVTVGREIFVASGQLSVDQSGKLNGTHLELVGLEQSNSFISGEATFDEILLGSHGDKAMMSIDGGGIVKTGQNFQIYGGELNISNSSRLNVTGDAMFGDQSEGGIDSEISLSMGSKFNSRTLSVWKDARVEVSESLLQIDGAARVDGMVILDDNSSLTVGSDLSLNDRAQIFVESSSVLEAQRTYSAGHTVVTFDNAGTVSGGDLTITSGELTIHGQGDATFNTLKTAGNLIVQNQAALHVLNDALIASGTSVEIIGSGMTTFNDIQLFGNLAVRGNVGVGGTLELNEGCGLTVSVDGHLVASTTKVLASMALENTGNNSGDLGQLWLDRGVELDLKDNNAADQLDTAGGNKVTVSGQGNQLGEVSLDATSSLWVKGTGTEAETLTSAGNVLIDNDLTITGETLELSGTTTVSGSLTASKVDWPVGNNSVTLLINGNTKSSSTDSMLTAKSGLTSDSFNVQIDMKDGISGLSGKKVVFAKNDTTSVEFNKTDGNFSFLSDGTVTEERDAGSHVKVVQTIGTAKTIYGYTFNEGAYTGPSGTEWNGTGITFDAMYSNQYDGVDENIGSLIIIDNEKVETEKILGTYDKATFSALHGVDDSAIVSKNTTGNLKVGAQVVKLRMNPTDPLTDVLVGSGAKTWEVSETTTILGQGVDSTQIGGLTEKEIEGISVEQLGQLNISSGSILEIENTSVTIGQTLSMGEGSSFSAKGSEIRIGTADVEMGDVSFEVPRYENGELVIGTDGQPVMETVTLSQELTQKKLRNVSLNLEDSAFSVDGFRVLDIEEGGELASSQGITFENATVVTRQTQGGTMELGSLDTPMTFNNSSVSGTGTLTNVVMNGGMLGVGNSPGTLYVNKGDLNNTALRFFIDPSKVDAAQSMTYGPDNDVTSLLTFLDNGVTSISGLTRVSIQLQVDPTGQDYVDVTGDTFTNQYSSHFVDGMTFQVIEQDSLKNVSFTGTLVDGSLPTLQDGLVWDYSKLFTAGTIGIAKGSYADAARIANTLVSAGETVSGFGQMSRSHVYDVRLNGTNVWANGLGTFLNHSSHNGRTGFEYNAGGYAVGADTIVDDKAIVGVAFGQSFGKHTPKAGNRFFDAGHVDMDSLMFGLYGGTSFNMKSPSDSMKLDAYASYGRFDNDSTHHSLSGNQTATASWKENAYAVGATLTRVHEVQENLFFSPFASLDYIYADMDSFTESAAQSIRYEGSAYQNLSLSLGAGLTRVYRLNGGQELSPFVSVAYVGDLIRKDAKVTSKNATGALVERSVSPGRNAFQVNVGTGWKITEQWGARVGYTAEFRSGATDQGVNVGVNYAF